MVGDESLLSSLPSQAALRGPRDSRGRRGLQRRDYSSHRALREEKPRVDGSCCVLEGSVKPSCPKKKPLATRLEAASEGARERDRESRFPVTKLPFPACNAPRKSACHEIPIVQHAALQEEDLWEM